MEERLGWPVCVGVVGVCVVCMRGGMCVVCLCASVSVDVNEWMKVNEMAWN